MPLVVRVIDFARNLRTLDEKVDADDDLLDRYLETSDTYDQKTRELLRGMHKQRKLTLFLDGMDEAGSYRELLEAYITCRLAGEVRLCVTTRPQGIVKLELFKPFFVQFKVDALNKTQQNQIVRSRLSVRPIQCATVDTRAKSFTHTLAKNPSSLELASNPLLLNLMLSEFMQHERGGADIQFSGRLVNGQRRYVASFPGGHKSQWDRASQVLTDRSVACTFLPQSSPLYGQHSIDKNRVTVKETKEVGALVSVATDISNLNPHMTYAVKFNRRSVKTFKGHELHTQCYCQTYLYPRCHPCGEAYDCPEWIQRDVLGCIIDESDVHTSQSTPLPGKKIEVERDREKKETDGNSMPRSPLAQKWCIATVLCCVKVTGGEHKGKSGHLRPPTYTVPTEGTVIVQLDDEGNSEISATELQADGRDGYLKVKVDGKSRWVPLHNVNQSGTRRTRQQPGQAPFGCKWFTRWKANVAEAEAAGQMAEIVYKDGQRGVRTSRGLGTSQMKEVLYLERAYGYGRAKKFKELEATEFEQEHIPNRAQLYKSATYGIIQRHSLNQANLNSAAIANFLALLSCRLFSHARDQFRKFDDSFLEKSVFSAHEGARVVWNYLQPLIHNSQFALILWEPDGTANGYRISHLSFQEYFCATVLVDCRSREAHRENVWENFRLVAAPDGTISSLLASSKFQVVIQMILELFPTKDLNRAAFARSMLRPNAKGLVKLSTMKGAEAATTLLALVSAVNVQETTIKLAFDAGATDAAAMAVFGRFAGRGKLSRILDGLSLKSNPINEIPPAIGRCNSLIDLDLSNTHIRTLPMRIGACSKLQKITLLGCTNLGKLPESIGNLWRLRELDVQECTGLVELPPLGSLQNLKKLDLYGCKSITCLPAGIFCCGNLKVLDMRCCQKLVVDKKRIQQQLPNCELDGFHRTHYTKSARRRPGGNVDHNQEAVRGRGAGTARSSLQHGLLSDFVSMQEPVVEDEDRRRRRQERGRQAHHKLHHGTTSKMDSQASVRQNEDLRKENVGTLATFLNLGQIDSVKVDMIVQGEASRAIVTAWT